MKANVKNTKYQKIQSRSGTKLLSVEIVVESATFSSR